MDLSALKTQLYLDVYFVNDTEYIFAETIQTADDFKNWFWTEKQKLNKNNIQSACGKQDWEWEV